MTKKQLRALLKKCDPNIQNRGLPRQYTERSEGLPGVTSLQAWVIRWVCGSVGYNPIDLLTDLTHQGFISGIVSDLIYTHDCVSFYTRFEADIWDVIAQFLDNTGETIGEFIDHLRPEVLDLDGLKTTLACTPISQ